MYNLFYYVQRVLMTLCSKTR